MNYLDEDITYRVAGFTVNTAKTYNYVIEDISKVNGTAKTIFSGNVYLSTGLTEYTFYLSNILRELYAKEDFSNTDTDIIKRIRVGLTVNGSTYTGSTPIMVYCMYRYPFHKSQLQTPVFDCYTASTKFNILLQGYENNTFKLLPRYPYVYTDNYSLKLGLEATSAFTNSSQITYFTGGLRSKGSAPSYFTMVQGIKHPSSLSTQTLNRLLTGTTNISSIGSAIPTGATMGNGFFINNDGDYQVSEGIEQHYTYLKVYNRNTSQYETKYTISSDSGDYDIPLTLNQDLYNSIQEMPLRIVVDNDDIYLNWYILVDLLPYMGKVLHFKFSNNQPEQDVSIIYNKYIIEYTIDTEPTATMHFYYSGNTDTRTICQIDMCPARYYLQWRDRGGSYQSQPFNDKITYNESFDREYVEDYKGTSKLSSVNVKPSWKLNSDWISEDIYPIYESIFVAPSITLYDSVEDKSYLVKITGDYTEKTYKNQKTLFNLNLDLESANNQKIRY